MIDISLKKLFLLVLVLWTAAFTLPIARAAAESSAEARAPESTVTEPVPDTGSAPPATNAETSFTASELPVPAAAEMTVAVQRDGAVELMPLEDAVAAVVAAEMPALFPAEALKAQAVAVRTYLCYRAAHAAPAAHPDACVCDDPSHCCAMAELSVLAAGWGENGSEYARRITDAVDDTAGQIVVYGGEPILAVFHAISSDCTNSSADVWGGELPYLIPVEAPAGERDAAGRSSSVVVDAAEFRAAFLAKHPEAELPEGSMSWFSDFTRASSGTVLGVSVGGVRVTGGELRSLCGLRSACFTVTEGTGRIRFSVTGYGHGVGLSQHGAKALALEGKSWEEIVLHYYSGCEVADIPEAAQ